MGIKTKIGWTQNTWNPWWGCTHVSEGCDRCYAEDFAGFTAANLARQWGIDPPGRIWGPGSARMIVPDHLWAKPIAWNARAARNGEVVHVFNGSMCDVFERRSNNNDELDAPRARLWKLIESTPFLIWMLLTKRPQNAAKMVPEHWMRDGFPKNVWVGATTENQYEFDRRVAALAELPAAVRFISAEPLLGPLDISAHAGSLQWIIGGGESGPGSRPMEMAWIRSLRDQSTAHKIPFFFKQWGNWVPNGEGDGLVRIRTKDTRELDGETWSAMPDGSLPAVHAPKAKRPRAAPPAPAPVDLSKVPTAALLAEIQRRMRASTSRP
ncbi:MAG: DUF5131 family protein [Polyangiales bacterium]